MLRGYAERIQVLLTGALLSYGWLVPLLVWLVLYPARIGSLGLYHDDWSVLRPAEPGEISEQFTHFPSRPVLVLIDLAAGYLVGIRPFAWQAIMALLALCSAFAIRAFVSRLMSATGRRDDKARFAGNMAAATWLALPWSLGYTAFPTTSNAMLCLIAFCVCSIIVVSDAPLAKKLWLGIPLTLLHGLTFEIFLGAPVLIAVLWALLDWNRRREIDSKNLILIAAFLFTEIALVAYNRLWAWFGVGQNKPLGLDALNLFIYTLRQLPSTLGSAVMLRSLCFALLAAIVCVAVFFDFAGRRTFSTAAILAVAGSCLVMSVLVFSLGGYGVTAEGIFSRTTFGISFWFCIGLASLVPAFSARRPLLSSAWIVSFAGFLILLSASQLRNLQAWRSSWEFEKSVIASFPVADYMTKAQPNVLLLIEAESPDQRVNGFNAYWDISSALFALYPQIRQFHSRPFGGEAHPWAIATMLNEPRLSSQWDGSSLRQGWCTGVEIWSLAAPNEILLWRYPSPSVEVIRAPTTFGCRK